MKQEVLSLIILISGLLLCMCGFRIQKVLITVAWFLIGYNVAGIVGSIFLSDEMVLIIIGIIAGVLLGAAGYKLEKLALFIAVAYLVYITIGGYIKISDPRIALMVHAVISLMCGALSTLFIKPILIGVSSLVGASIVYDYLPLFISIPSNILLIIVIILFITGIIVQIKTS